MFYFEQIQRIVEEQHVLTPFNFFLEFLHCLTVFLMFLTHKLSRNLGKWKPL